MGQFLQPQAMFQIATELQIGTVPPIIVGNGTLRVDWTVEKRVGSSPDTAEIRVFNLGAAVRRSIASAAASTGAIGALPVVPSAANILAADDADPSVAGSLVARGVAAAALAVQRSFSAVLSVGWSGRPELLFLGQIWKYREQRDGVDIVSVIHAGDGATAMRDTAPKGGADVGIGAVFAITLYATALGFPPSPSAVAAINAAAAATPLASWIDVHDRPDRDQLDDLMRTIGLDWGVQNGELVVFRNGLRDDLPPLDLSATSGLLRAARAEDGGVEFDALSIARALPGRQVLIRPPMPGFVEGTPMGGPLRIESVRFAGSSQGPALMSGVARKVALL